MCREISPGNSLPGNLKVADYLAAAKNPCPAPTTASTNDDSPATVPVVITGAFLSVGLLSFYAYKRNKSNILKPEKGNLETVLLSNPIDEKQSAETTIQLEDSSKI